MTHERRTILKEPDMDPQSICDVADRHLDICIICGPGCCAPVLGVHTSCPGPAVGTRVVAR